MIDFQQCCGCGACSRICVQNCIQMQTDAEGFLRAAAADPDSCIHCGMCDKVCPVQKKTEAGDILAAFCGQNTNKPELAESTSGGVFSILARYVLNAGGCVWGVEMDANWKTVFVCIADAEELYRIRGSKYVAVQQPIPFETIARQLKEDKLVLFSGVPCQVKALAQYLAVSGCSYRKEQLILVDLFCYGVQSPLAWEKYLEVINPEKKQPERVFMRRKKPSWEIYSMEISFADGSSYEKIRWKDPYLKTYSKGLYNNQACAVCTAKAFPKVSDLTLGDFWSVDGLERNCSYDIAAGMSVVIVNSLHGVRIAEKLKEEMIWQDIPVSELHRLYPRLGRANPADPRRDVFMQELRNGNFAEIAEKYVGSEWKKQIRFSLRPVRRWMKNLLKNKHFSERK